MLRRLALSFPLAGALLAAHAGAQNPGFWEPAFNHVVPVNWQFGQPGWDGEVPSVFTNPANPHRFMAGHMALIPKGPFRGQVLVWNWMRGITGIQYWSIVDPVTRTFQNFVLPMPPGEGELFCAGHAWTRDGDLFVAGGNLSGGPLVANDLAYRFVPTNPVGNAMWVREPDMDIARWYPTVTTLGTDAGGNDLLIVSRGTLDPGNVAKNTYEAFDPAGAPGAGTWQPDPTTGNLFFNGPPVPAADEFIIYPRAHVLSDGKLFFAGMSELGYRVDHTQVALGLAPVWEVMTINFNLWRLYGSSVLFPNIGGPGGGLQDIALKMTGAVLATPPIPTNTTEFVQAALPSTNPSWNWQLGPSLVNARARADATLLPDGTILSTGGKLDTQTEFQTNMPVLAAELFNDQPAQWRTMATAAVRRGYHSTAALLPDGRVLIGGGENREMDYEIFQPHYLRNGTVRPSSLAPPTLNLTYGDTVTVPYTIQLGTTVQSAVLMAPASITHHSDMHQRYVELTTTPGLVAIPFPPPPVVQLNVNLTMPATSAEAPRGLYMLFLVTNPQGTNPKGTPSTATWVNLQ